MANLYGFNPRTRKGCDPFVGVAPPAQKRFNPRTRKGCDRSTTELIPQIRVSIHAPVKDAT